MTEAVQQPAPALGVSLSVNLSATHALVMQTHVPADCSNPELDSLLDRMTRAADRQSAKYKLVDLRKGLELHETTLDRAVRDLNDLDARHRADYDKRGKAGDFRLDARQAADRENTLKSIQRFKEEIAKLKLEIENAEKEIK